MTFIAENLNVSTAVCIVNTNSIFDCENIFYHMKLDRTFIGAKYHDRYKGTAYSDISKRTGCFFNQITLPIVTDKVINIKVFNSGKLSLSGVKEIDQVKLAVSILIKMVDTLNGINKTKIIYKDDSFYNQKEYNLYKNHTHTRFDSIKLYKINGDSAMQIGERKGDEIILFGTDPDDHLSHTIVNEYTQDNIICFLEKKMSKIDNKTIIKQIFNKRTGKLIGKIVFKFLHRKRSIDFTRIKFIKCENEFEYDIIDNYKNVLGKEYIIIDNEIDQSEIDFDEKIFNVSYQCRRIIVPDKIEYNMVNINAGFKLKLIDKMSFLLLREDINDILIKRYNINSICMLDGGYPAINVKIYYDKDMKLLPFPIEKKDTHKISFKNSISIFENGSILTFNSQSLEQLNILIDIILKIFNECSSEFIRPPKQIIEIKDKTLDIWDLLVTYN